MTYTRRGIHVTKDTESKMFDTDRPERSGVAGSLILLVSVAVAAVCIGSAVAADEFECKNPSGCLALWTPGGKVIEMNHHDIVRSERGWVCLEKFGWVNIDGAERVEFDFVRQTARPVE